MRAEVFAHPISLRHDPGGAARRLADTGITGVRLAYAYHSGRWLLTTSDPAAVVDLDAGLWFRPASTLTGPVQPAVVAELADAAAAALQTAGLRVTAWLVGLHSTPLASAHPELAIRNVFDHPYRHALCPARPQVSAYVRGLVADVARRPHVSGLELEAFSYLGWAHQSAHDKTGAALRRADQWLLSLCVCDSCAGRLRATGVNPAELTTRARAAVRRQLADPRPPGGIAADTAAALGADLRDAVLAARADAVRDLVAQAVDAAGPTPVSVRATADPYACDGKAGGDLARLGAAAGGLTVTHLGGDAGALRADLAAARPNAAVLTAGWSGASAHTAGPDTMTAAVGAARDGGATSFVLYAYDLVPAARLPWVAAAVAQADRQVSVR
jgi:hypothetical protein